jgi:hypothetical protein
MPVIVNYQQGDGQGAVSTTEDAELRGTTPTVNTSTTQTIEINRALNRRGLIKFPNIIGTGVGQIPPGSKILHASLLLTVDVSSPADVVVYRLAEPWSVSETTWENRDSSTAWTQPGAHDPLSSIELGIFPMKNPGIRRIDVTSDIQAWADGNLNAGWLLRANEFDPALLALTQGIPTQYSVETGLSPAALKLAVDTKINAGWVTVGGITTATVGNNFTYIQAMTLPALSATTELKAVVKSADATLVIDRPRLRVSFIEPPISTVTTDYPFRIILDHLGGNDVPDFAETRVIVSNSAVFESEIISRVTMVTPSEGTPFRIQKFIFRSTLTPPDARVRQQGLTHLDQANAQLGLILTELLNLMRTTGLPNDKLEVKLFGASGENVIISLYEDSAGNVNQRQVRSAPTLDLQFPDDKLLADLVIVTAALTNIADAMEEITKINKQFEGIS